MSEPGFFVTFSESTKGFKIKFPNNYLISVLFGEFTESDSVSVTKNDIKTEYFSETAQVAVISPEGKLVPFMNNTKVRVKVLPEELPQIISWVMNR